jgi:PPOX class probable F420-dependent enzyme
MAGWSLPARILEAVMRRNLRIEDLGDLLDGPAAAVLATYRRDGSALLSPVWFRWDGAAFEITLAAGDHKIRHIERDPRVVLTIFEPEPPFRGLELRCEATLRREGVLEARLEIASKYVGAERGQAFAEERGDTGFVLRLEPGELRAWDFADRFPVL